MKIALLLTFFVTLSITLSGQQSLPDSLERKLNTLKEDSLKVKTLNQLVLAYEFSDTTKAWKYIRQSIQLSNRLNYQFGHGDALRIAGILLMDKSDFSQAKIYFDNALKLFNNVKTRRSKLCFAITKHWIGIIHESTGNYLGALTNYIEAAKIFEQYHDETSSFYTHQALMGLEFNEKNYQKGLAYANDCLAIGRRQKNKIFLTHAHLGIASAQTLLENFKEVSPHLDSARILAIELDDKRFIGRVYYQTGEFFNAQNNRVDAIKNYLLSIDFFEQTNDQYQLSGIFQELGECYLNSNRIDEAELYLNKALNNSLQFGLHDVTRVTYRNLSDLKKKQGNYPKALDYLNHYLKWNDSIRVEQNQKQIKFLEAQYQNEKKVAEIARLQKDKKYQQLSLAQKSFFNYVLGGSLLTLLIIGILFFRNVKSKQKLSQQTTQLQIQRIRELEQEKKLISYNALLKGQEDERSRMAQDLHDGLGGMLSSVKLTLGAMKGNTILSEDNTRLFSRALDQLDQSISEMRRVAHNMMPEALVRFGMQQAIQDYCDGLREGSQQTINTQFYGLENRLDANTEIIVYRIIQELLNNVMKHAQASEVFVQVMRNDNNLNITIEDNGKGFVNDASLKKGAGLTNVQARVDYLKGQIDIQSIIGHGTSIHIDCIV